jgi:hypothetical protein
MPTIADTLDILADDEADGWLGRWW